MKYQYPRRKKERKQGLRLSVGRGMECPGDSASLRPLPTSPASPQAGTCIRRALPLYLSGGGQALGHPIPRPRNQMFVYQDQPEIRGEAQPLFNGLQRHIDPLCATIWAGVAPGCASWMLQRHMEALREFRVEIIMNPIAGRTPIWAHVVVLTSVNSGSKTAVSG